MFSASKLDCPEPTGFYDLPDPGRENHCVPVPSFRERINGPPSNEGSILDSAGQGQGRRSDHLQFFNRRCSEGISAGGTLKV
jgi:hypothetical protein